MIFGFIEIVRLLRMDEYLMRIRLIIRLWTKIFAILLNTHVMRLLKIFQTIVKIKVECQVVVDLWE